MADDHRLDGWKAIGNFLGRDRTTAIRWTKQRGLPVHRVPGGRTGTVYALRGELNDWLANGVGAKEPAVSIPAPLPRRQLLVGAALVAGAAVAGVGALRFSPGSEPLGPTTLSAQLMNQAQLAFTQYSRDGQSQAVGLLQRVVADQPDYADGWGALAMIYACSAHWRSTSEAQTLRVRARASAERAEALDPTNSYAAVARSNILPTRGNWLRTERALRRAMAHADHAWPPFALGVHLQNVGRNRESADLFRRLRQRHEPNPAVYHFEIMATWSANRLEEADRLIDEAAQLYPSQYAIWFARLYIRMYTGRTAAALAMIDDIPARPTGVPASEFASIAIVVRAMANPADDLVDEAIRTWREHARAASGYAESAIQFAAALGRVDDAYRLIDAFYFDRGYAIPEVRFTAELGVYSPHAERQTGFLFWPVMAPVRRDPRFAALIRDLGLDRYWRESGRPPDIREA